ncbi:hypothetical protein ILYODFUR_018866 [Ilyodon furcidens]|uniref:Uncharacterized protein n=1 Tax=Ilyodon furcidens TaxID=33524 RepID=A0ABV0SQW7_9TELE
MSFLRRVVAHFLRDRVRRLAIQEGLGVEPLLLHIVKNQAFVSNAPLMPLSRGVSGTSHWEKAQDMLDTLCIPSGIGTPWAPPRRAGGGVWGEGSLGVSAETAAPTTRSWICVLSV